jgi:shikimate dehydrogenase
MHHAAYEDLDMYAKYSLYPVKEEKLAEAIKGAEALGIDGLNVTVPHKEAVKELEFVEVDPLAEKIGAVNTLDFTEEGIKAYNTDAVGARRALEREDVEIDGKEVTVVGAGGASRAISFELADKGAEVRIANRTEEKAHELAENVSKVGKASGHSLDELEGLVETSDILVNSTSVGMKEDKTVVPKEYLHSDLVVFDAVYNPLETRLLREAKEVGADTVDGAWMLVYQGVKAFEIWTGREPPEEKMREALMQEL